MNNKCKLFKERKKHCLVCNDEVEKMDVDKYQQRKSKRIKWVLAIALLMSALFDTITFLVGNIHQFETVVYSGT